MNLMLMEFIEKCAEIGADPDTVFEMLYVDDELRSVYDQTLRNLYLDAVDTKAGPVYKIPVLTPVQCNYFIDHARTKFFAPNTEEEIEYQINEHVMAETDEGYRFVTSVLMPILNAYSLLIYSTPIKRIASVQFAKYSPDGTPGTGWHHDRASDVTCVVSLNPGEFEGGGTGIRTRPDSSDDVPPLNRGMALFFNGKAIQHRGLPVTSGTRLLLVIWMET